MHPPPSTRSHMPNVWQYRFLSIYTHADRHTVIEYTEYKCVTCTVSITVRIQRQSVLGGLGFDYSLGVRMESGFGGFILGTDRTVGPPREWKSWGLVRGLVQCWPTLLRSWAGGRTWLSHAPLGAALCFGPGLKPCQMGQVLLSYEREDSRAVGKHLKGQFTPKSKIHILYIIYGYIIYQSR